MRTTTATITVAPTLRVRTDTSQGLREGLPLHIAARNMEGLPDV